MKLPSPTQTITFGAEADGFAEALRTLCCRALAVTIALRCRERFAVVLVSAEEGVLIYERWDEAAGLPSGKPATVEIGRISEVAVE